MRHWECTHRRMWSLWEVLKFNAEDFQRATTCLSTVCAWIYASRDKASPMHNDKIPEADNLAYVVSNLIDLMGHLHVLGAKITLMAVEEAYRDAKDPNTTWERIRLRIEDVGRTLGRELSTVTLLHLNAKEKSYFEPETALFGNDVATKFPSEAAFEIDEAAKCLALGRSTASVFHLMRTMEIGVRATARCLGVPDPVKGTDRNWMTILRAIKAGIDTKWPNATARMVADATLFESLHASLDAVRNPWRNATMHVESKYTDDEAEHIFIAVKGFMKKLASRCDEEGNPRA